MSESSYCEKCGEALSVNRNYCSNCSHDLNDEKQSNVGTSTLLTNLNELENESISEVEKNEALLSAFVGEEKQSYYLRKWKNDNRQSFNWAAFFGSFFWLGYRKMYKVICSILLLFIVFDLVILLTGIDGTVLNNSIAIGLAVVLGAGGNSMYKSFAQQEIEKLKTVYSDDQLLEKVSLRGGGSWNGVWISLLLVISYAVVMTAVETLIFT